MNSLVNSERLDRIEIIIVNDGSRDNTLNIAQKYKLKYPRSIVIIDKENGGHGSGINASLKVANGKYFRVLDSDDWVDTEEFDKLIDFLENSEIDMVHTNYHRVDMITGVSTPINDGLDKFGMTYNFDDIAKNKNAYFSLPSTTYKTDILKNNSIHIQEKMFYVDVEYHILPLPFVNSIINLDLYIYKYMVGNVNQSVSKNMMVKNYNNHENMIKYTLEKLRSHQYESISLNCSKYIENIMMQVIRTNYLINIEYNSDFKDATLKAQSFDRWFKVFDNEMHSSFMKRYFLIKVAERFDFDRSKMNSSLYYKTIILLRRVYYKFLSKSNIINRLNALIKILFN